MEMYIDAQFDQYFKDESGLNRKNIKDNRVHCCLYFVSPFGHGCVKSPQKHTVKTFIQCNYVFSFQFASDRHSFHEATPPQSQHRPHHRKGRHFNEARAHPDEGASSGSDQSQRHPYLSVPRMRFRRRRRIPQTRPRTQGHTACLSRSFACKVIQGYLVH